MGLDSVELVMDVENYFNIRIKDQDAEKLATVGDMTEHVSSLLGISNEDRIIIYKTAQQLAEACNTKFAESFLNSPVTDFINFQNKESVFQIQQKLELAIPYIHFPDSKGNSGVLSAVKTKLFQFFDEKWRNVSVEDFIISVLAHNIDSITDKPEMTNKFEVYLAIVKLTADKVGVKYYEAKPEAKFTDDLGID